MDALSFEAEPGSQMQSYVELALAKISFHGQLTSGTGLMYIVKQLQL